MVKHYLKTYFASDFYVPSFGANTHRPHKGPSYIKFDDNDCCHHHRHCCSDNGSFWNGFAHGLGNGLVGMLGMWASNMFMSSFGNWFGCGMPFYSYGYNDSYNFGSWFGFGGQSNNNTTGTTGTTGKTGTTGSTGTTGTTSSTRSTGTTGSGNNNGTTTNKDTEKAANLSKRLVIYERKNPLDDADKDALKQLYSEIKKLSNNPIDDIEKDNDKLIYVGLMHHFKAFFDVDENSDGDPVDIRPKAHLATTGEEDLGNYYTILSLSKANLNIAFGHTQYKNSKDPWIIGTPYDIQQDANGKLISYKIDCSTFTGSSQRDKYIVEPQSGDNWSDVKITKLDSNGQKTSQEIKYSYDNNNRIYERTDNVNVFKPQ